MTIALAWLAGAIVVLAAARWAVWRGFRVARIVESGSPADLGLVFDEVSIPTTGGKRLFGWLVPGRSPSAPLVVIMHGWGANAQTMLPLAAPLIHRGYAVLLVDARSHGRSDGDTFSSMPRFAEDIESAVIWASTHTHARSIALMGHSVGGAASLLVASRRDDIGAVISLSAFDHPERVMRTYLARAKIPFIPLGWLVCRYVERIIGHRFDSIAPIRSMSRIHCPVLIGHGADDLLVLPEAAHAIHAQAASGRAELVILDDTGHDEPASYEAITQIVGDFLDRSIK